MLTEEEGWEAYRTARTWKFENGVRVCEVGFIQEKRGFEVYGNNVFLGSIYPDNAEGLQRCIESLDAGCDPITGGWDNGCGIASYNWHIDSLAKKFSND